MRNWKQRLCSLLLCGAMLASLCPTALAEDVSISYLDETGREKSCETYIAVTEYGGEWWEHGWYVAQGSIEISHPIPLIGEVHLILANGCELKASKGINVGRGSSLTIYAQSYSKTMGKLEAYGGDENAAIGGGGSGSTVNAASNDTNNICGGAGIGGGGSIPISGGTVEASSASGADIGGGFDNKNGIVPSDNIEISEGANVKGSGSGGELNIGPTHGAKTDEWAFDGTSHWHPCKIESCAEQFDKDAHSFGDWVTDQEAATTPGSKHRVCAICQYREEQTIPPVHGHGYGNEWKSDAASHWHECSCGDKSGEAAHSFGD